MIEAYQQPLVKLIVVFCIIFVVLAALLGAYQAGKFSIDVIVKEEPLITLTKLEPNETTISLSQNEKASKLISALLSHNVKVNSSVHGFDQLNKINGKKVINLTYDDRTLTDHHFFNLYVNPSNNPNLTAGNYEGYVEINYNNSKEIKTEFVKIELKINQVKPDKSLSVTP